MIACECERYSEPNLSQTLRLMNSPMLNGKVSSGTGRIAKLIEQHKSDDFILKDIYSAALGRSPRPVERNLVIGVLAALAAMFPWELGHKADPFAPAPNGIKPEWYFLFMFQTLKYLPAKILAIDGEVLGILTFSLGGLLLFLVPFLNKTPGHGTRRLVFQLAGVFVVIFMVVMTIVGFLT